MRASHPLASNRVSIGLKDLEARKRRRSITTGIADNDDFVYVALAATACARSARRGIRARLAQLRIASPFLLELAFIGVTTANPFDLEPATHRLLAGRRLDGEWFDISLERAKASLFGAAAQLGCKLQEVSLDIAERTFRVRAGIEPMPTNFAKRSNPSGSPV